jgi:hypothetical protein
VPRYFNDSAIRSFPNLVIATFAHFFQSYQSQKILNDGPLPGGSGGAGGLYSRPVAFGLREDLKSPHHIYSNREACLDREADGGVGGNSIHSTPSRKP